MSPRWSERYGRYAIVLLLALVGLAAYRQLKVPRPGAVKTVATPAPSGRADSTPAPVPSPSIVSTPVPPSASATGIDAAWARLQGGSANAADLAELRRQLLAGDPPQSI